MDEINVTRVSVAEFGVRNLYHVERNLQKTEGKPLLFKISFEFRIFLKFPSRKKKQKKQKKKKTK